MRSTSVRFAALFLLLLLPAAAHAATTLTVAPIAWNVVGLDSNSPATGPANFPVGARVCSSVATTNVAVTFVWDTANARLLIGRVAKPRLSSQLPRRRDKNGCHSSDTVRFSIIT